MTSDNSLTKRNFLKGDLRWKVIHYLIWIFIFVLGVSFSLYLIKFGIKW